MSKTAVFIDNKEYITASEAGLRLNYTKEYMLMLIKQGKIDGKKIGNKWFVFFPSAEEYFEKAILSKNERLQKLSQDRKIELQRNLEISKAVTDSKVILPNSKIENSPVEYPTFLRRGRVAILETLVIVFLGVSVGSLGYIGYGTQVSLAHSGIPDGFLSRMATVVYDFFSIKESNRTEIHTNTNSDRQQSTQNYAIGMNVGTTTVTSIVIMPDDIFSSTSNESVENAFSDEVRVTYDFDNKNTGIIAPVFTHTEDKEYRFMLVPINNLQRP